MKIGDRVIMVKDFHFIKKGDKGTVVEVLQDSHPTIGVEFDSYDGIKKHNLKGLCKPGHGYYVYDDSVETYTDINQDIQILKDKYPEYNIDVVFN